MQIVSDARTEYSGIRNGGWTANSSGYSNLGGQYRNVQKNNQAHNTIAAVSIGQRPNTIHRALMS